MRKIEIKIVKEQDGLPKGTVKSVDRRIAVDMVDREIAEYTDKEVQKEVEERKAKNAELANKSRESNEKKAEAKKSQSFESQAQKMMLGKRKKALEPFADFVDLKSDEFKLTLETTKEEFQAMKDAAEEAKATHEANSKEKGKQNPESDEKIKASEPKKAVKKSVPKGSKGSKKA